jgi:Transposase zinc-binding domain
VATVPRKSEMLQWTTPISCSNRHCPKCQGAAARRWLANRVIAGQRHDTATIGHAHAIAEAFNAGPKDFLGSANTGSRQIIRQAYDDSASSNALASFRSGVSKPSVNQP